MNFKNINIVSIDDNENNLYTVELLCEEMNLNVTSFQEPKEALSYCLKNDIDIILIDFMMPDINGLEFIERFRKIKYYIPIIMITAAGDDENIHKAAFDLGVSDFLNKPINPMIFEVRLMNVISNYLDTQLLESKAKLLEKEVTKATQDLINREIETLKILAKTASYKDHITAAHVTRVSHYSKLLAKEYGLTEKEQDLIYYAAPFHDLGKVGIEDKILLKPGKLTGDEFEIMKTHSIKGYEILKDSKSDYLKAGASIALTHHEKYDGSGYPYGLKAEDIHIYGRIVAIADVFDALTSTRPYEKAWSFEDAINYLFEERSKHFDPVLIDLFLKNKKKVKKIYTSLIKS
mgnify:CR=1 FL=1